MATIQTYILDKGKPIDIFNPATGRKYTTIAKDVWIFPATNIRSINYRDATSIINLNEKSTFTTSHETFEVDCFTVCNSDIHPYIPPNNKSAKDIIGEDVTKAIADKIDKEIMGILLNEND